VSDRAVATGYRFLREPGCADPAALRDRLEAACDGLTGTVLVAREGVNLSVCGAEEALRRLEGTLDREPGLEGLRLRRTAVRPDVRPFRRLRVRLRTEIVALGGGPVRTAEATAEHLDAAAWNALLAREDVLLVDARNDYEWHIGRFRGAPEPGIDAFRELPERLAARLEADPERPVATYCTGGIRCEKLTAWLAERGFRHVYQLDGGILGYLEAVRDDPSLPNLWEGDCFVFDDRVALDADLTQAAYGQCRACHHPLTFRELASPRTVPGERCPYCDAGSTAGRAGTG
jgi:UPF0176 protein